MGLQVILIFISFFSLIYGFFNSNFFEKRSEYILPNYDYLNTAQIAQAYGYPGEVHTVKTRDGYILHMYRIPYGKYNFTGSASKLKKKPPILLQHGFLGSSNCFVAPGPKKSLPFILANLGFDVWLANTRGNSYSRAHVTLSPNEQAFWNFSWHESGVYDLPAQIDYICNYTKQNEIVYIGYSMASTIFFVMSSIFPEYNGKIKVALLMAVFADAKNLKGLNQQAARFSNLIQIVDEMIFNGEYWPHRWLTYIFGKPFSKATDMEILILHKIFSLYKGKDMKGIDKVALKRRFCHFPAGSSAKALNHFGQTFRNGKFQQYDYGPEKNNLYYGSPKPAEYKLEKITTPIYFYESKNDHLSSVKSAKKISKRLPCFKRLIVLNYTKFNHADYLVHKNVDKELYYLLIDDMVNELTN